MGLYIHIYGYDIIYGSYIHIPSYGSYFPRKTHQLPGFISPTHGARRNPLPPLAEKRKQSCVATRSGCSRSSRSSGKAMGKFPWEKPWEKMVEMRFHDMFNDVSTNGELQPCDHLPYLRWLKT